MPRPIAIEGYPFEGATYLGRPVVRIVAILDNGAEVAMVGGKKKDASESERNIENMAKRIREFLVAKQIPLSRKQIARGLGLSNSSGWFGVAVKEMIDANIVEVDEDGCLSINPKSSVV